METQTTGTIKIQEESLQGPFAQIPNFILANPTISSNAKVLYGLLISYAWQKNYCFPGQDRLAKDMGKDRTQIMDYLAELRKHGLISWEKQGFSGTNVYTLLSIPQAIKDSHNKRGEVQPIKIKKVTVLKKEIAEKEVKKDDKEIEELKEAFAEEVEQLVQPAFRYKWFADSVRGFSIPDKLLLTKKEKEACERLYNTYGVDLLVFISGNLGFINQQVKLEKNKSHSFSELERNILYYIEEIDNAGGSNQGIFKGFKDFISDYLKTTNLRMYRHNTNNGTSANAQEQLESARMKGIKFPTYYDTYLMLDEEQEKYNQDTLSYE